MLAEIDHTEKYLTLGCGHTAAFCKFVLAGGGPTSEPSLQDESGKLAVHRLEATETFKSMIHDVREWTVVRA